MDLKLIQPALDTVESEDEVDSVLPKLVIKAVPDLDVIAKPWAGLDKLISD